VWNCAPNEILDAATHTYTETGIGDAAIIKQMAIQRGENEGGEILRVIEPDPSLAVSP